jgi:CspA family cold shock protein
MTRVLIAAASALFLGAVTTELYSRLFASQYFALLVLTVAAVFIGSIVTNRVSQPTGLRPINDLAEAEAGWVGETTLDDDRETGRVKWFNRTKGFGFIIRDNGGEIFVHHRNIRGSGRHSLKDGEQVRFKVVPHDKGLQAEQVSVAGES